MNLFEMLEYGALIAHDEELGLFITVNGSYLNLWVQKAPDVFENIDCKSSNIAGGWLEVQSRVLFEIAEAWIEDIRNSDPDREQ